MEYIIIHYTKIDGEGEYIVIMHAEEFCDSSIDGNCLSGFRFRKKHEADIEEGSLLPLDRTLRAEW